MKIFSFLATKKRESGQAMIIAIIFFLWVSLTIILGLTNPVVRHISMATSIAISKESFYAAEAGTEDAVFRLKTGKPVNVSQTLTIGSNSVVTTVADDFDGKIITSTGDAENYFRKVKTKLIRGTGVSFHYGIQAGRGGFVLRNSSSVTGNVHSGGPVIGEGNFIYGDVVSSGPTGWIFGIHATGTAFAHTIGDSSQATTIEKDAHFVNKVATVDVWGVDYPGSPDKEDVPLPISDAQIEAWKNDAVAGGVIEGTDCAGGDYDITSDITIGPKKINCDLSLKGNGVKLTMAGPIWVVGNIYTQTSPIVGINASLGNQNVALIADKPSDRTNSGIVDIGQGTIFEGSGSPNSFVFVISQNNSSEMGGTTDAINIGQSAGDVVAYASHGQITLGQSVNVKEATSYKIILLNTANVTYDTGLPSTLFSSGPSGGYEIDEWKEIE